MYLLTPWADQPEYLCLGRPVLMKILQSSVKVLLSEDKVKLNIHEVLEMIFKDKTELIFLNSLR